MIASRTGEELDIKDLKFLQVAGNKEELKKQKTKPLRTNKMQWWRHGKGTQKPIEELPIAKAEIKAKQNKVELNYNPK